MLKAYYTDKEGKQLRFFATEKELKMKTIEIEHKNCHFGRDRMLCLLRTKIYGATREEVVSVFNFYYIKTIKACTSCQSMRMMNTKNTIKPIVEKNPRDRYICDLIDVSAYKHKNDGISWIITTIDSFSKFSMVIIFCIFVKD